MHFNAQIDQSNFEDLEQIAESDQFVIYAAGNQTYVLVQRHQGTPWMALRISGDGLFRISRCSTTRCDTFTEKSPRAFLPTAQPKTIKHEQEKARIPPRSSPIPGQRTAAPYGPKRRPQLKHNRERRRNANQTQSGSASTQANGSPERSYVKRGWGAQKRRKSQPFR